MYNDVKSCINYNNCKSAYFSCDIGVRQGVNMSPDPFNEKCISTRGRPLEKMKILVFSAFTLSPLSPNTLRILVLLEACNKSSKLSFYLQVNLMLCLVKPTAVPLI
jgi:hypothetical protein